METCPQCQVPVSIHGTVCGWENAHTVMLPFEILVKSNLTGDEKRDRYEKFLKAKPPRLLLNSFEKLTALQKQIGYDIGPVNPIALLGLVGEAGEVLKEITYILDTEDKVQNGFTETIQGAVTFAKRMDDFKKKVRDEKVPLRIFLHHDNEEAFDEELGDCLYYLNALALGRGKTLDEYAENSFQKVFAKTQKNISTGIEK